MVQTMYLFIVVDNSVVNTQSELSTVQSKLCDLRGVLNMASSIVTSCNIRSLQQDCLEQQMSIERISRQLEDSQSLNCGGQFVWTDSVLVNCLRDGHWLLIDNVNFCR